VTAIHSKVVSYYLEVIHGAGLVPLQLMTESQAIAQVILPHGDPHAYILAALRETKAILLIVSGGTIHFTSTIALSSDPESPDMIVTALHDEIQKLISYWQSHGESQQIEQIIICGSRGAEGLDIPIARTLNMPVHVADAWKNIASLNDYLPQITNKESQDYIPALGLALPND
jgi:hypothetical protein